MLAAPRETRPRRAPLQVARTRILRYLERRRVITLDSGVLIDAPLSVREAGFSLHAASSGTVSACWLSAGIQVSGPYRFDTAPGHREILKLDLLSASRALVRGRVLARLATALHALSVDQEAHFARESAEIGRMVGGWLRALTARQAAARAPAQKDVGAGGAA